MISNNIELNVLVGGRRITEYVSKDKNQNFVEGRKGSEYEIEIHNTSYNKVEAVVSVDGRSVIDGKSAGSSSTGYILHPHQKIIIPGFLVNGDTAAKFVFGSPKSSYAAQMSGGDTSNVGVIGVRVYNEKYYSPLIHSYLRNYNSSFSCSSVPLSSSSISATTANNAFQAAQSNIGTEFGAATDFKTRSVLFERGDLLTTLALYYDDRDGLLKNHGIKVEYHQNYVKPNPFPADSNVGCTPPLGWVG